MNDTMIKSLDDQENDQPEKQRSDQLENQSFFTFKKSFLIFGLTIVLGILSGYSLAYLKNMSSGNQKADINNNQTKNGQTVSVPQSAGIADQKNFKDSATGILREGGKDGEGSFHLERPGGESQNVYLTSSGVDLSLFVGRKVKVLGETFKAQKVGWLMDVGYIEVVK